MQEKINNLTGVRAFAALWVALYHFTKTLDLTSTSFIGSVLGNGPWAVDVFFVLSGFILSHIYLRAFENGGVTYVKYKNFIIKRFARLYPMSLFTFMLAGVFLMISMRTSYEIPKYHEFSFYTAILNIFMIQAWGLAKYPSWNQASWSISAEWFAYLFLFYLIVKVFSKMNLKQLSVCVGFIWMSLVIYSDFYLKEDIGNIITFGILRIIPEFLAGYLIYETSNRKLNLDNSMGRFILKNGDSLVLISIGVIVLLANLSYEFNAFLLPMIMLLIWGLFIGGPYSNRVFGNQVVVYLGEISYSLYLMHTFVNIVGKQVVEKIHYFNSPSRLFLMVFLEVLLVIPVASFTFHFIEKPLREKIVSLNFSRSKNSIEPLPELP
jgi:peptidoglycan/LPS O-acetylase OafA/YrhL